MKMKFRFSRIDALRLLGVAFLVGLAFTNCALAQCDFKNSEKSDKPCNARDIQYEPCSSATRAAEQYVITLIRNGKAAKLAGGPYQSLRGCFVRELLTGKEAIPQAGVMIAGATITGPVDLRNAEIAVHVELTHCTFLDDVNLSRSHFVKGLSLVGSTFGRDYDGQGRLDTESAVVDFDFNTDDCTFNNCFTSFKGTRVGVDWTMRRSRFAGSVDFTGANIGGNFFADREDASDPSCQFQEPVDFESMKVGLNCGLSNVVFGSSVNFGSADFNGLSVAGSCFGGDVNFKSTKINNFYLFDIHDTSGVQTARQFNKRVNIEDMQFQYMSPEDWVILEAFAEKSNDQPDQSHYSAQFYSSLEAQFRRHGRPDEADEVFIAGMRKQRKNSNWYRKAGSYFIDTFIGYGRHLERLLFWWSPILIFLGCIVFWKESNMETKRIDDQERFRGEYKGVWYTVDLFLPIIRLGEAEIWTPRQRWRTWYKYCHIIVGNLFVPIGLAAWTGIIR